MYQIAQEVINFQTRSQLGDSISAIFQEVIDQRDNLEYPAGCTGLQDRRFFRIREVKRFCEQVTLPKFIKCVKDKLKINITTIHTLDTNIIPGVTGLFAVTTSFGHVEASVMAQQRMTGTGNAEWTTNKEVVEELRKMAENVDLETGTMKHFNYLPNKPITCEMYFDINGAFLAHDFLPLTDIEPLTAQEIAAIMMHECGHIMTIAEHANDLFVTKRRLDNFKAHLTNPTAVGAFAKEAQKLIPVYQRKINQLSKNNDTKSKILIKNYQATCAVISGINELYSRYTFADDDSNFLQKIAGVVVNTLCWTFLILCSLIESGIFLMYLFWNFHLLSKFVTVTTTVDNTKAADERTTPRNLYLIERWADEYVSRQGYGEHLASGLNKIMYILKRSGVGSVENTWIRNSTIMNLLFSMFSWLHMHCNLLYYCDKITYEEDYARNKRILQNTYAFFKNNTNKMPAALVNDWLDRIERIKAEMEKSKTLGDTPAAAAFFRILTNISSPVEWVIQVMNGDLDHDYTALFDNIDDIKNNPLFYQAAALSRLAHDNRK